MNVVDSIRTSQDGSEDAIGLLDSLYSFNQPPRSLPRRQRKRWIRDNIRYVEDFSDRELDCKRF